MSIDPTFFAERVQNLSPSLAFFKLAIKEKVAFVPGEFFYIDGVKKIR